MNRDEVIRMARSSGVLPEKHNIAYQHPYFEERLERFAALVAAAEREACAKVAEAYEPRCDTCPGGVANAIRARGQA